MAAPIAGINALGNLGRTIPAVRIAGTLAGANNPVTTVVAGAAGKGASSVSEESGQSPLAQALWGVVGSLGASSAASMVKPVASGGARVLSSWGGPEGVKGTAGRLLNRQAGDEAETVQQLLEAGRVPTMSRDITGFSPTSSDIAGNSGVSSIRRFINDSNLGPTQLSERANNNSQALQDHAMRAVGSDKNLAAKEAYINNITEDATKPMRNRNVPVNINNVAAAIDRALLKHKGGRGIEAALNSLKADLPEAGSTFNTVYNFKQHIDDTLRSKHIDPKTVELKKAAHALKDVKQELNKSLTAAEPGFNAAIKQQAIGMRQLKEAEEARKLIAQVTLSTAKPTNIGGVQAEVFPLGAAKFQNKLTNKKAMDKLSPRQQNILRQTGEALRAGTRGTLGMGLGSNTMQNANMNRLVTDDVIRGLTGSDKGASGGLLSKYLNNRVTSTVSDMSNMTEDVTKLLLRAELDPAFAAEIMKKYQLTGPINFGSQAGRNAARGGLLGGSPDR
tara:strand:- start:830 stop:2344 length:1515 start_codon:yes stop_codon:yes gene_type:complete